MSTVALPTDYRSNLTVDYLRELAKTWNIQFTSTEEEEQYLLLLQSAEAIHKIIQDEPDFIDPELAPVVSKEPRQFWKPSPSENANNAWSHRCNIEAANPKDSVLKGRLVAIKDNICVGGLPTTVGAFPCLQSENGSYRISSMDSTVVKRLLEAGAIIKGTATCEMYSAAPISCTSANGPVHNPWAAGFSCGGSSSGYGCLIGMNAIDPQKVIPFGNRSELAIGGDQGGSIRIPASYNGIYGLKPTLGLIPYTGAASITPMIDHLGPMANNIHDIAVLLKVLAGYDGLDPRMTPESPLPQEVPDYPAALKLAQSPNAGSGLRIGLLKESFDVPGMSEKVRNCVRNTTLQYFTAMGATVEEISIPLHSLGPAIWTASTRMHMSDWACGNFWSGFLSHQMPHLHIMNLIFSSKYLKAEHSPEIVAKAQRKVFQLRRAYDEAFRKVDVLITPTTPTVAQQLPKLHDDDGNSIGMTEKVKMAVGIVVNTCGFNVTGHPAMNVPCGFEKVMVNEGEKKLPIGLQMVARRWDEVTLLRACAVFEQGKEINTLSD